MSILLAAALQEAGVASCECAWRSRRTELCVQIDMVSLECYGSTE